MTDHITELIDAYCSGWNEPDPHKRLDLLVSLWSRNPTYMDPTVHVTSVQELVDHIEQVRVRRTGAVWNRTSPVDTHHNVARFTFNVTEPDGTILLTGLDIVELGSGDARIDRITGFFNA